MSSDNDALVSIKILDNTCEDISSHLLQIENFCTLLTERKLAKFKKPKFNYNSKSEKGMLKVKMNKLAFDSPTYQLFMENFN